MLSLAKNMSASAHASRTRRRRTASPVCNSSSTGKSAPKALSLAISLIVFSCSTDSHESESIRPKRAEVSLDALLSHSPCGLIAVNPVLLPSINGNDLPDEASELPPSACSPGARLQSHKKAATLSQSRETCRRGHLPAVMRRDPKSPRSQSARPSENSSRSAMASATARLSI